MNDSYWHEAIDEIVFSSILPPLEWPKAEAYARYWRKSRGSVFTELLPMHICEGLGKDPQAALPLAASTTLLFLAARMLDDWQDKEGRGNPWGNDPAKPVYAVGLIGEIQSFIARNYAGIADVMLDSLGRTIALASRSQLDTVNNLQQYLQHKVSTTGITFQTIAGCSAIVARANPEHQNLLEQFGLCVGIIDSIIDDLTDMKVDTSKGKKTLLSLIIESQTKAANHGTESNTPAAIEYIVAKDSLEFTETLIKSYQEQMSGIVAQLPKSMSRLLNRYVEPIF